MSKGSVIQQGAWVAYGAIAVRVCTILSNVALARLLMPAEFGVIGVAYIFWSFANLFTLGTASDFIVYKGDDSHHLNTTYTITLAIGSLLGLALVGLSPFAAVFFQIPNLIGILIVFAINLVLSFTQSVHEGILRQQERYREIANVNLIASFVRVCTTVGCAIAGLSYWSFVIGDSAFWLTVWQLMRSRSGFKPSLKIEPQWRSEVLSYCLGGAGSSLGYYVNTNADNVVVGKLLGSASLGFYNLSYQITMTLNSVLTQAIGQVSLSSFSQLSDDRKQQEALVSSINYISFLTAPLYGLFFLLFDRATIRLIFGEKWEPIATVIPGLLVFAYFRLNHHVLLCMLSAKGRPDLNAKMNLPIAPLAVLAFLISAHYFGIVGVSMSVAVVLGLVWTIASFWFGCRAVRWNPIVFLVPCFQAIALAFVSIAVVFYLPLLLKAPLFLVVYEALLYVFVQSRSIQHQRLVQRIFKRVSHKFSA